MGSMARLARVGLGWQKGFKLLEWIYSGFGSGFIVVLNVWVGTKEFKWRSLSGLSGVLEWFYSCFLLGSLKIIGQTMLVALSKKYRNRK